MNNESPPARRGCTFSVSYTSAFFYFTVLIRRQFHSCAFLCVHMCNVQKGALNAASHSVSELIHCVCDSVCLRVSLWVCVACVQLLAHNQWPPACVVLTPTPCLRSFQLHCLPLPLPLPSQHPFSCHFQLALNFVLQNWRLL